MLWKSLLMRWGSLIVFRLCMLERRKFPNFVTPDLMLLLLELLPKRMFSLNMLRLACEGTAPFLLARETLAMKRFKLLLVPLGFVGLRHQGGLNMNFLMTLDIELFLHIQRLAILVSSFLARMAWQRRIPLDFSKTHVGNYLFLSFVDVADMALIELLR